MSTAIQIRKTDDGVILARRLDGKPLTPEDREEAKRMAADRAAGLTAQELIDNGNVVAVVIDSTLLGAPIWFALNDGWRPEEADSIPIFYASELPALRVKTPEQLRSTFNVKRTFGGGKVRQ